MNRRRRFEFALVIQPGKPLTTVHLGRPGAGFKFQLRVTGGVLESQGVNDADGLIKFLGSKGADIIEGVINRGVRGDQEILWESDGVSVG